MAKGLKDESNNKIGNQSIAAISRSQGPPYRSIVTSPDEPYNSLHHSTVRSQYKHILLKTFCGFMMKFVMDPAIWEVSMNGSW